MEELEPYIKFVRHGDNELLITNEVTNVVRAIKLLPDLVTLVVDNEAELGYINAMGILAPHLKRAIIYHGPDVNKY